MVKPEKRLILVRFLRLNCFYMLIYIHKFFFVLFLTFWFSLLTAFGQTIVYVTQSGAGNQSGSSWSNALPGTQLQPRLASASAGTQFWVAGGIYKPTTGTDRNISFSMPSGVQVYGWFMGNESSIAQRQDTGQSSTIFSGEIGDPNTIADNTFTLVNCGVSSPQTLIDGVGFIRAGYGIQHGVNRGQNIISTINIKNCWFDGNSTGVYNSSVSGPELNTVIEKCIFTNNRESGLVNLAISVAKCFVTVKDSFFENNSQTYNGGAISSDGAEFGYVKADLENCVFSKNKARNGGAIGVTGNSASLVTAINCRFTQNTATNNGGVFYTYADGFGWSSYVATNCLIVDNSAFNGGVVYSSMDRGTAQPSLINCTLSSNTASNSGAAVYNKLINSTNSSFNPKAVSCIFRNNAAPANSIVVNDGVIYNITYSNIQGGFTGTGNIDADPQFVDPANGNYRLQPGSPSINTGDPASTTTSVSAADLAGNPRIDNNRIDMGAYERQTVTGPILTLKEGNWNDPFTWLFQQLPGAGDTILIRHRVGLPASYVGKARTVQYDTNGQLVFSPEARLNLN